MTREEMVSRWEEIIIPTVFRAEGALRPRLKQILDEHADDPTTGAELYIHAIAVEIVSHTTDKQLEAL